MDTKKTLGDDIHRNNDCLWDVHRLEDSDIQGMVTVREIGTIPRMVIVLEIVTVIGPSYGF